MNDSALVCYATIISVQKLRQVIHQILQASKQSETQQKNTKVNASLRQLKWTGIKAAFIQSIGQKEFSD